jgi:hypothetical protein
VRVPGVIVVPACSIRPQHPSYLLDDTFRIRQHLSIPESQHSEPEGLESPSSQIVVRLSFFNMLTAVEFDDQPGFNATEIDDEGIDRNLPAELPSIEVSVSQNRPEALFGLSCIVTKYAE